MKKTLLFCLTAALLLVSLCSCQVIEEDVNDWTTKPVDGGSETVVQPNNDYPVSQTSIESGNASINPLRFLLWSSETVEEGETGITNHADGSGRDFFFENDEADHTDLPAITLQGELSAVFPANTSLVLRPHETVSAFLHVYDTHFQMLKYAFHDFSELDELSPGEYVIVFTERYESRGSSAERMGEYDCIFKLIVPEKTAITHPVPDFDPLTEMPGVQVQTGDQAVTPLSYYVVGSGYSIDESGECACYEADGSGAFELLNNPDIDPNSLPTITLDNYRWVEILLPEYFELRGMVSLYNLDRTLFKRPQVEDYQLSWLPNGEYIVVFSTGYEVQYNAHGMEHTEFARYDHAFRLCIKNAEQRIYYSNIEICCGDQAINPIRFLNGGSEHVIYADGIPGPGLEADGPGFHEGFGWPDEDHAVLPTLILTDAIVYDLSPYTTASTTVTVVDTSFDFDNQKKVALEDLQDLAPGEYAILLNERYDYSYNAAESDEPLYTGGPSSLEPEELEGAIRYYATYSYRCVFKLIVPEK